MNYTLETKHALVRIFYFLLELHPWKYFLFLITQCAFRWHGISSSVHLLTSHIRSRKPKGRTSRSRNKREFLERKEVHSKRPMHTRYALGLTLRLRAWSLARRWVIPNAYLVRTWQVLTPRKVYPFRQNVMSIISWCSQRRYLLETGFPCIHNINITRFIYRGQMCGTIFFYTRFDTNFWPLHSSTFNGWDVMTINFL